MPIGTYRAVAFAIKALAQDSEAGHALLPCLANAYLKAWAHRRDFDPLQFVVDCGVQYYFYNTHNGIAVAASHQYEGV